MKELKQKLIYILAGAGVISLLIWAMLPSPIKVDTAVVKRQDISVTVDAEGKTRLKSLFVVSAPVAGRLERIQLEEGDRVEKGDIIARIEPLPLDTEVQAALEKLRELEAQKRGVATLRPKTAALAQAQAQIRAAEAVRLQAQAKVAQAEASLAQAKYDLQRSEELASQGAIPRKNLENDQLSATIRTQELEVAKKELAAAEASLIASQEALAVLEAQQTDPDYLLAVYDAQIASVRAELNRLTDEAQKTTISAPVGGSVLRVLQESQRYVTEGTPLLELGNPRELELVIDVLSIDAVKIRSGMRVLVEHWGGEVTLEGKVLYVEPAAFTEVSALGVEEQRVNVIAEILNPPPNLGAGYRVEGRIVIWEGKDLLVVPISSLFRCQQAWCTFVVEEGKARKRKIELGKRSTFAAVVKEGLEEKEVVIIHPPESITDGSAVLAR